jgi:asparagine synthase (glutamine-hydrolysing)
MCGITGYLAHAPETDAQMRETATRMAAAIAHRGPDSHAVWADAERHVALGHRRLAIVDLSPQGAQPMASHCGRYVVAYNGEIYNHPQLRAELDALSAPAWRGHSDTETMLAAFTRWGIEATLPKLVGMFAIAVWDRQQRELTLVRDRMGEKPLYWGRLPRGDFVFGSELKALRAHPRWQAELNRDALALYMRHMAVPAPHSIHRGISKLMPGAWLRVGLDGRETHGRYWNVHDAVTQARASARPLPDAEAADRLEALLSDAIRGQMLSDVPLGAFLSGGVDSSTIVALMTRISPSAVRTFSIGFDEKGFDEAVHAKAVAQHLGTQHTELYVTAADALAVIPKLPSMYDEPFADSSQIPTSLVAAMARRHVTVALSGDAGDELFAGYNRYLLAERVWRQLARVPLPLRRAAAGAVQSVSPSAWTALARPLQALMPEHRRHAQLGDKLHKFARSVLALPTQAAMYRSLVSQWQEPAALVLGAQEPRTPLDEADFDARAASAVEHMSLLDQQTYLPDDILVKVDRAAMAVSLETRVPLLDHRIVEFAAGVPMAQKIRPGLGGGTKWLLRQVLYRHVPRELIERPKQGFAVPLAAWLRGPLRDWAEALIEPARLKREGVLDAALVRQAWDAHLCGNRHLHDRLWTVLMFQAWQERQGAAS